ncbi:MAG TPA: hypothetical protein VM187_17670 [Niastella sp.]|nr:hypothetical protein [Niastella sp.]
MVVDGFGVVPQMGTTLTFTMDGLMEWCDMVNKMLNVERSMLNAEGKYIMQKANTKS